LISRRQVYLFILVLAAIGVFTAAKFGLKAESEAVEAPSVLFEAPDFSLKLYNEDRAISLSDYKGKTVVLNFWATWCVSCRLEAPDLEKTWQAYKNEDVVFIGINLQERPKDIQKFVEEYGTSYPIVIDEKSETIFKYGVRIVPTTVFINKDGMVVYVYEGLLNDKQLVSLLEYTTRSVKERA
jgi:peroxiredoxin